MLGIGQTYLENIRNHLIFCIPYNTMTTTAFSKYFVNVFRAKPERRPTKYRWTCYLCGINFEDFQDRDEHMRMVHYGEVE